MNGVDHFLNLLAVLDNLPYLPDSDAEVVDAARSWIHEFMKNIRDSQEVSDGPRG